MKKREFKRCHSDGGNDRGVFNENNYFNKCERKITVKNEGLLKAGEKINLSFKEKTNQIFMNQIDGLFEEFLYYINEIEFIKEIIEKFNKSGSWIKNLRPTKTFLNFIKKTLDKLEIIYNNNRSNNIKKKIGILSDYIILIKKIRENNVLKTAIRGKILENKGEFNAYNIMEWLLISDTSARNQLKRMFTEREYQEYIRTQKHVSIDIIEDIVAKKGGKCHTKTIQNAKSKLHIECAEGHHFYPIYDSIVYQGTWCPDCHIYVGETICRRFFERIFKKPFPKSYPSWLINEDGNQMELDGRNKDMRLSFEYQGIQHRKIAFGMTYEDLRKIQGEDELKLKLCEENGEILLQIPDDEIVPYSEMQEYIENEYKRKTGITLKNIPRFDYRKFVIYENIYAKRFREYVENKGGVLMTPYFNAKTEVTILCENGHEWTTTPNSVYQGNWCSHCFGNIKGKTEYFRQIGRKFGCKLINDYVNAKRSLWYRCQKGHEFKKSPYWLKKDNKKIFILCPYCKLDMYTKKFKKFVNKKGGKLSTPYKGRFKPIKIKCKRGHIWETTPAAVYQGNWCQICKKYNFY